MLESLYPGILISKVNHNYLFNGYMRAIHRVLVVQRFDNTIHWMKLYSVDNAIGFLSLIRQIAIYPFDSVVRTLYNCLI